MKPNAYSFTEDFTLAFLHQLTVDPVLASRAVKYLTADRMPGNSAKLLADVILAYSRVHRQSPTRLVVEQLLQSRVTSGALTPADAAAASQALIEGAGLPAVESSFALEQVLVEERKSAMWTALENGMKRWKSGEYLEIAVEVDGAAKLGRDATASLAVDYTSTIVPRTQSRVSGVVVPRLATGISPLDAVIKGGLADGELGCILGAPKHGKSQSLSMIAMTAMGLGGTAVYFTLEMSRDQIFERMDAAISRTPIDDLAANAQSVEDAVVDFVSASGGSLVVQEFPPGNTTVDDLEESLRMRRAEGVIPTVVVVDYGDLLTTTDRHSKRHEELGNVYTDLRRLASNWKIPIWTASQARREALEKSVVTMADVGESFKKVQIADVVIALCGTEEERQNKLLRFYVAACRYASGGVMAGPIKTAFEQGRIWDDSAIDVP